MSVHTWFWARTSCLLIAGYGDSHGFGEDRDRFAEHRFALLLCADHDEYKDQKKSSYTRAATAETTPMTVLVPSDMPSAAELAVGVLEGLGSTVAYVAVASAVGRVREFFSKK
jgi:hypothetical protein